MTSSDFVLNQDLDIHIEELFSGPFDLLLHLVRKHELELHEIPLGFITEKYLAAIKRLQELNVELASDFLVIAATLVELKSRFIVAGENNEEEEELEDPASVLAARLELYRRFRQIAIYLNDNLILERSVWKRQAKNLEKSRDIEKFDPVEMKVALEEMLPRLKKMGFRTKTIIRRISLADRISTLLEFMEIAGKVSFSELIRSSGDPITTFLAVLEIVKLGIVSLVDSENDFYLRLREEEGTLFSGISDD